MNSKINLYTNDKREYVKGMFNSIHRTYDILNHTLSFGIDIYWRKKALSKLTFQPGGICLDLASGTGDFGIEVYKKFKCKIIGYDFAENTLRRFRQKIKKNGFSENDFLLVSGEAE
ncbi:MAG: methyltransferase domain-containing protein, partial [Ignavibacteria bacterium]|nr:methyltransferase domain-containing protein [Ignavibacteria bacterium]